MCEASGRRAPRPPLRHGSDQQSDRYQLALDVIERVPRLGDQVPAAKARYWSTMERHKLYLIEHGQDMPEVLNWQWTHVDR